MATSPSLTSDMPEEAMPEEIVLASGNAKKIKELSALLSAFNTTITPQSQYQIQDAVEDGLSFIENALIKARHAAKHSGKPAIADDSGLVVDALDGEPGVYTARYGGSGLTAVQRYEHLLSTSSSKGAVVETIIE